MPRFFSEVRRRLARSRSKGGRISFMNSTTSTSTPKLQKMLANSMPITPPPMMQRRLGSEVRLSISVDVNTPFAWAPSMGRNLVVLPVAMMMWGAVKICSPSSVFTLTVWVSTNCASPSTSVMPGVFMSMAMPERSRSTVSSLWATALASSSESSWMPRSRSTSSVSAVWQRHFVGIQPALRHVPPSLSFSMMTTCCPNRAALTAVS